MKNKFKRALSLLIMTAMVIAMSQFMVLNVSAATIPIASNPVLIYTYNYKVFAGNALGGNYYFNKNGGTVEKTGSGGSTYTWQISTDNLNWSDISGASSTIVYSGIIPNYTIASGDVGKYIRFAITPVNTDTPTPTTGTTIYSSGVIVSAAESPMAHYVNIVGQVKPSTTVTGSYTYNKCGVTTAEAGSQYIWQSSQDKSTWTQVATGTISTSGTIPGYTVATDDAGKYIRVGVEPRNATYNAATNWFYSSPVQVSSAIYAQWATGYGSGNAIYDFNTDNICNGTGPAGTINNWNVSANATYSFLNNDSSNTTPYFISADAKRNVSTFKNSSGDGKVIVDIRLKTPDSSDTTNSSNPFVLVYLNDANAGNNVGILYAYKTLVRYTAKDSTLTSKSYDKTGLTAGTWYYVRVVLDYNSYKATLYSGTSLSSLTAFATNVDMSYYAANANTASLGIASIRYNPTTATTSGGIDDLSIYGYPAGGAVKPSASTPTVSVGGDGTYIQGNTLTASTYTYIANDGGTEVASDYVWEVSADGSTWNEIASAKGTTTSTAGTRPTYTIASGDINKYIRFTVKPKGNSTLSPFTNSDYTPASVSSSTPASKIVGITTAPSASCNPIGGYTTNAITGNVLTGTYTYNNGGGTAESGSQYKWQSSTDNSTWSDISGASGTITTSGTVPTYTVQKADVGKYIRFGVEPRNSGYASASTWYYPASGVQVLTAQYALVDDFETGYTAGTSATGATVNGWVAASGKTITITGANSGDANTSWFMSTGDATKTFATAINNSSGNNIVVLDARVKTPATGAYWWQTKGSNNAYLTQIQVGSNYIQYNYNTLNNSAGVLGSSVLLTGITITPNTWYYVRQVLNFSTKRVTLYYSTTTINSLSVFKTDVATSTTDFCYTSGSAPTDLKSLRNNNGTIDDVKLYYGNTSTPAITSPSFTPSGTNSLSATYSYTFSDDMGDADASIYQWQSSVNGSTGWTTVATGTLPTFGSGTLPTYTKSFAELTKFFRCAIIPAKNVGPNSSGTAVYASVINPTFDIKLVNAGNGTDASVSAGGTIKGKIVATNDTGNSQSYILICGLYNGNKLIGTVMSDSFNLANGASSTIQTNGSFTIPAASGYTVKAFLWQDTAILKPLAVNKAYN